MKRETKQVPVDMDHMYQTGSSCVRVQIWTYKASRDRWDAKFPHASH